FRLLATLETRGYVEQDKETERYRLSAKTFQLARVFLHHLDLRRQAHASLEALGQKCGETVYLGLLERGSAVYVDVVESEQAVRVAPRLGRSLPAWCTAAGKALFASRAAGVRAGPRGSRWTARSACRDRLRRIRCRR
ncbi:MAG: IclR family transcriptional regulator, partial [Candidatus Tectimicrobiota bacterium]